MINTVEMGKNYALYLLPLYGGIKNNVLVIGKTNIDNVSNNEDEYNVYETFFKPLGLGLTSYYTAIQKDTPIYICRVIDSLEPLNITDERIFIPESLIDKTKSSEYIEAYNFNFSIYPLIKRFDNENLRDTFIQEITEKIKTKLKELIEFSVIENEVQLSYDTIYLTKDSIETLEDQITKKYNDRQAKLRSYRQSEQEKEEQYNQLINDLQDQVAEYKIKNKELDDAKSNADAMARAYRDKLNELTS